ncbi:hypothetical protein FJ692_06600 [Pseudomonas fluorescens]|nr:hypothetical protein C1751_07070 [Pseudomonas fluorescens]TPV59514.1 hypothetical protein FJ692_06600 [Pseudomonas fluorescens]
MRSGWVKQTRNLWRGSLLPFGCAAAADGGASHPSGSKLPRHTHTRNVHICSELSGGQVSLLSL